MKKILSKIMLFFLSLLAVGLVLVIGGYCIDLARYLLPAYSYYISTFSIIFVLIAMSLVGLLFWIIYVAFIYIKYFFCIYVLTEFIIFYHPYTKNYKEYKKMGLEGLYWDRLVRKMKEK